MPAAAIVEKLAAFLRTRGAECTAADDGGGFCLKGMLAPPGAEEGARSKSSAPALAPIAAGPSSGQPLFPFRAQVFQQSPGTLAVTATLDPRHVPAGCAPFAAAFSGAQAALECLFR